MAIGNAVQRGSTMLDLMQKSPSRNFVPLTR
jgi:hypothetical protein